MTHAHYTKPSDLCAVADPSLLPPEAGTVIDKSVENEGTTLPLSGCAFMLDAPDGINTFKVFVAAGEDATAQFQKSEEAWKSGQVAGFRTEPVARLGQRAFYTVRSTAEARRIDSVLVLQDDNLYLEVRFLGGGAKKWNESTVRDHLVTVARDAMTKLAKT